MFYFSKNLNYRIVKYNWLGIEECKNVWLTVVDPCTNCNINVIVLYKHPKTRKKSLFYNMDNFYNRTIFCLHNYLYIW